MNGKADYPGQPHCGDNTLGTLASMISRGDRKQKEISLCPPECSYAAFECTQAGLSEELTASMLIPFAPPPWDSWDSMLPKGAIRPSSAISGASAYKQNTHIQNTHADVPILSDITFSRP